MRTLLLAAALGLAGCAHLRDNQTVCPQYRDLRCLTRVDCSYDRARGCEACSCAPLPVSSGNGLMPPTDAPK